MNAPIFLTYRCASCQTVWQEVDESAAKATESAARALTNHMRPHFCSKGRALDPSEPIGGVWGAAWLVKASRP